MRKCFMIFFLLLGFSVNAQEDGELLLQREKLQLEVQTLIDSLKSLDRKVEKLVTQKKSLKERIIIYRDSMKSIDRQRELLRQEKLSGENAGEDFVTTSEFLILEDTRLMSRPGNKGKEIRKIGKGEIVLKIDELRGSFLVCIGGDCGYIPENLLRKVE